MSTGSRGRESRLLGTESVSRSLARSPFFLIVAIVGGIVSSPTGSATSAPSPTAIADIPADYLVRYQDAAARFGVDWAILAAIGKIECDHGRLPGARLQSTRHRQQSRRDGPNAVPRVDLARRDASDDRSWNRAAHEYDRRGIRDRRRW